MRYEHTQVGYVTGGALIAVLPFPYYAFTVENGELGAFGLLAVLFSGPTVQVTDRELLFYFGPGFWERRFDLDTIERVETVRNSALYGWDLRYTRHGWLYNVSGLQAVEVTVRGEEKLRLGTDEPEQLKTVLERAGVPSSRR